MVTFLFSLAMLFLVIAAAHHVYKHPEVLDGLRSLLKKGGHPGPITEPRSGIAYMAGPAPFTQRIQDLPADTFLHIRVPDTALPVQMQVITAEILHIRQRRSGSEWVRRGGEWPAVYCRPSSAWSRSDVLIIVREWGSYIFKTRTRLGPEDAKSFVSFGKRFEQLAQKRGAAKVEYDGKAYAIQDAGVYDVEAAVSGQGHIPSDPLIARYMIAHNDQNEAFLIEDAKDNHDSVWRGFFIPDINRAVTDVLTSGG
jgi:hypothetical protein